MDVRLDMYMLVAFVLIGVGILVVLNLTSVHLTRNVILLWLVLTLLGAPLVRRFIINLARKIHMAGLNGWPGLA